MTALSLRDTHSLPVRNVWRWPFTLSRSVDLVEARISDGIGLHHFGLASGYHPYVRAVAEAARPSCDDPERAIREALAMYFNRVQPQSPADWLDMPGAPSELVNAPPHASTLPWQKNSPARWQEVREKGVQNENRLAGDELPLSDGWHACGPVSDRKLDVETCRLLKLLESIQRKGLQRHNGRDGDIDAVLLRSGRGERWWINSGHHRSAVLSALGYKTAPVRIKAVIDTTEAKSWPQVQSGLFTEAQAVRIVERLVDGDLPRVASEWVRYVDSARRRA